MSEDKKQIARVALKQRARGAEDEPYTSTQEALRRLGERYGVPPLDLGRLQLSLALLEQIPREIAERHQLIPVKLGAEELTLAMVNPHDEKCLDELSFVTGKRVVPLVVPEVDLLATLERAYLAQRRGERYFVGPHYEGEPETSTDPPCVFEFPEPPAKQSTEPFAVPELDFAGSASQYTTNRGVVPPIAEAATKAPEVGEGPLVLVVDDDEAVLGLMQELLLGRGHRVRTARAGPEAIESLKNERPALVVLDAMLPGLHGFEIARRLQLSRRFSSVPVLMVSALHRGWEIAEDLRRHGVIAYLEKPFKATAFLRAVDDALGVSEERMRPEAETELQSGLEAFKHGDAELALAHMRACVALEPNAFVAQLHLGLLLGRSGRQFEAISALERAAELSPRDFACIKTLAILYEQSGFPNKSVELWQRAARLAPDEQTRVSIQQRLLALAQSATQ